MIFKSVPKVLKEDNSHIFFVGIEGEINEFDIPINELSKFIQNQLPNNGIFYTYRGTNFLRIKNIIKHGVEGDCSKDAFWASLDLNKAMEYGRYPKLVLCYDYLLCERSFISVDNTIENKSKISILKKNFKSHELSIDNKKIWFSQFPIEDKRRTTNYEVSFGNYIPKNTKKALKYQFAIAIGNDWENQLHEIFSKSGIKFLN